MRDLTKLKQLLVNLSTATEPFSIVKARIDLSEALIHCSAQLMTVLEAADQVYLSCSIDRNVKWVINEDDFQSLLESLTRLELKLHEL